LDIVDEGVNSEIRILFGYWGFHGENIDDACYLLEWITWDSIEFEKVSRVSRYSFFDPCVFYARFYYAPFWCELCKSSDHETNLCPYYAYYAQPDFASP